MLAYYNQRSNTMPTHSAPAGWTQIGSTVLRNGQIASSIWYKAYEASDASGVTFTSTLSRRSSVQIVVYAGIGSAAPIAPNPNSRDNGACSATADGTGETHYSGFGSGPCYSATYRASAKALNVLIPGGMVVGQWIHGWSSTITDQTWDLSGATGMTARHQSENDSGVNGLSVVIADASVVSTGSTGDKMASPSDVNGVVHSMGRLVMLCPGAAVCGDNGSSTTSDLSTVNNAAATYTTGSATTITMTMTNTGLNITGGASWTAVLPSNFASTTWTCAVAGTGSCGTGSGSGNTVTLTNVALNSGSTATITFTTTPTTPGTASATSTVAMPSGWYDSNTANDSSNVSTTLSAPSTDLSTVNNTATSYTTGSATTITMTMSNSGTNIAGGAGWTAGLPSGFASTTWSCAITAGSGSCGTASGSGNTATLANVALNSGSTATITFSTTPTTAGTGSSTSTVTAPSGWNDSSSSNNTSNVSTTLTAPILADLQLVNTSATPMPVRWVGSGGNDVSLRYEFTVTNAGPSAVTGASFTFTSPAGTTIPFWECKLETGVGDCSSTDSGQGYHRNGGPLGVNTFTETSINLNSGATLRYIIRVRVTTTFSNQTVSASIAAPSGVTDAAGNNSWSSGATATAMTETGAVLTFNNSATGQVHSTSATNTVTIGCAAPAWVCPSNNDVLIAYHVLRDSSGGSAERFVTPSGWSKIGTSINNGGQRMAVYWIRSNGVGTTWNFQTNVSGYQSVIIAGYSGVNSTNPAPVIGFDALSRDAACTTGTAGIGEYMTSTVSDWNSPCFFSLPASGTRTGARAMPLNASATGGRAITFMTDNAGTSQVFGTRDLSGLILRRAGSNGQGSGSDGIGFGYLDREIVSVGATEPQPVIEDGAITTAQPIAIQLLVCSGASACGSAVTVMPSDLATRWVSVQDAVITGTDYRIDRNVAKLARLRVWNNGGLNNSAGVAISAPGGFTYSGFTCTPSGGASCGTCNTGTMSCAGMVLPTDTGLDTEGDTNFVDITFNITANMWNTAPVPFTILATGDGTTPVSGTNNFASINIGTRGLGNFVVTPDYVGSTLSCEPLSVTISAKDQQGAPFVPEAGWTTEVRLYSPSMSAPTIKGDWKAVTSASPAGGPAIAFTDTTVDDGMAVITWNGTANQVTLQLRHYYDETVRVRAKQLTSPTQSGTGACLPENSATPYGGCGYSGTAGYNFDHAGMRAVDSNGNAASFANGVAGTALPTTSGGTYLILQAVQSTGCTGPACLGACSAGDYAGARQMQFKVNCTNPSTCASGLMSIGQNATAVTSWPTVTATGAWEAPVSLTFGTVDGLQSAAKLYLAYRDVGNINVQIRDNATPTVGVTTGNFIVRPSSIAFTAVQGNASYVAPVDATSAKLVDADTPFSVTIAARDATGTTTPNFGRETTAQSPVITASLVAPTVAEGGILGSFVPPSTMTFYNGSATFTTQYGDVGIIALTATLADYLGGGTGTLTSASGNIGRFGPNKIVVTETVLVNRVDSPIAPGASGAGFNYMGEKLRATFKVVAQNANGVALNNYRGTWGRLGTSINNFNLTVRDMASAGTDLASLVQSTSLSYKLGTTGFTNGAAEYVLDVLTSRPVTLTSAYETVKIGIAPNDGDVMLSAANSTFSSNGGSYNRAQLGGDTKLRQGRIYVMPFANTSPTVHGTITLQSRFYDGSVWVDNALDGQTVVPKNFLSMPEFRGGRLNYCETYMYPNQVSEPPVMTLTSQSMVNGRAVFRLRAPGKENKGSILMNVYLGQAAPGGQVLCENAVSPAAFATTTGWAANTILEPALDATGAASWTAFNGLLFEFQPPALDKRRKLFARENF